MLLLNSPRTVVVDGITVFPDHSDENEFWVLPGPVQLGRRDSDNRAQFTFIKYKPAAVEAGVKGGGFLMFEVNLRLTPALERKILSRLSGLAKKPHLNLVQFDEGTVQCIALNVQGPGGTEAEPIPGSFRAVEKILGASVPSMQGDETAAFSLTLDQEGAIILEQAFTQGTTPIGVIYDMKFTGMRPALQVEIKADMNRVFNQFSANLSGQVYFVKAAIDVGFEKLVEERAIDMKVTGFATAAEIAEEKKFALDMFKDQILTQFFTPTLTPGSLAGGGAAALPLPGDKKEEPKKEEPKKDEPKKEEEKKDEKKDETKKEDPKPATSVRQPAKLTKTSTTPTPLPAGFDIEHTPAAEGTKETITIKGTGDPTVKVDGVVQTLSAARTVTLDVAASSEHKIEVAFPRELTFEKLFFDFDEPLETGWNASSPPKGMFARYVKGTPTDPPDDQFNQSKANFLEFIAKLADPKEVELEGQASFEIKTRNAAEEAAYTKRNQGLSQRRLDVGVGLVGDLAKITKKIATGHTAAKAAGTNNDQNFRCVEASGFTGQAVTINATLSRPADQQPTKPDEPKKEDPKKEDPKKEDPKKPDVPKLPTDSADIGIALKLKFIHQEERRTIEMKYTSSDAIQRRYAPQGFFGLLLNDLEDKASHFVEVDLDDPFFRVFTVTLDAPIDFKAIGLTSAQIALDYGNTADATNHKHGDFIFEADRADEQTFQSFLNKTRDTDYRFGTQYHFDPQSGWEGERFSYDIPAKETEDRTLFVNPFEDLGFLTINVVPNRIDFGIIDSIDVLLKYDDGAGFQTDKTFFFNKETPRQQWLLRLTNAKARTFTQQFTFHLKDGTTITTDPKENTTTAVAIDDPFEDALNLLFVPTFDPATTRVAFVDVHYLDDTGAERYERTERLTVQGADTAEIPLRIALFNRDLRTYSFRVTIVGTDNSMQRGQFQDTTETIIPIS